jgi:hypothetical protein
VCGLGREFLYAERNKDKNHHPSENAEQPVRPVTFFGDVKVFKVFYHDALLSTAVRQLEACRQTPDGVRVGPSPLKSILVGSTLVDRAAAVPAFIRLACFHCVKILRTPGLGLAHIDYSISMNRVVKKYLIEDHLHRAHLPTRKQHGVMPLFVTKRRRKTMINKAKLALIAAIAALSLALPAAALAQSAYTTGTAASRAAAGYPSPYGNGGGLYAYAPGHFTATPTRGR